MASANLSVKVYASGETTAAQTPVSPSPGSDPPVYRSAPERRGNETAKPVCARRPNDGQGASSRPPHRAFLHRCAECAVCSRTERRLPRPSDYRSLCPSIVAFVQAQMLRLFGGRLRPFDHNGVQRQGKQLGIRRVGPTDAGRKGPAIAFDQDTFLDARLATVTGVGTDAFVLTPLFARPLPGTPRALPRQPSAACQCHSTP